MRICEVPGRKVREARSLYNSLSVGTVRKLTLLLTINLRQACLLLVPTLREEWA
jgi:hypothetical protein